MDTVRLARDLGDVSSLYPDGIDSLVDLPHPLFDNVRSALVFLSFEELPKDERPPKRIWLDEKAMKEHMAWVEKKREAEYSTDKDGNSKDIEDPVSNDAASTLIVGD